MDNIIQFQKYFKLRADFCSFLLYFDEIKDKYRKLFYNYI